MCPHCVAAAVEVGAGSLVGIPVAIRMFKAKLSERRKKMRQEAMKANFDVLYGKGPDMGRANPGYVAFQKAMKDE